MRRRDEAIEAIEMEIDIFENPSDTTAEEKEGEVAKSSPAVPLKQLDFNRIQY